MKISIYIFFAIGLIFILGTYNKKFVAWARRVGRPLARLERGSSTLSELNEDSTKRWLILFGALLIAFTVRAVFFK